MKLFTKAGLRTLMRMLSRIGSVGKIGADEHS
jgi:hypothetical protein